MRIALLESLTFGIDLLDEAAIELGAHLTLLTRDDSLYSAELPMTSNIDVVHIDTFDEEALFEYLDTHQFDGLLSNTDTWTESGSRLQERLGLPGRSAGLSKLLRDKAAVRSALLEAGISRVVSRDLPGSGEAVTPDVELPVIIKPKSGTGSRDIFVATDLKDFEELVDQLRARGESGSFITEPFLAGPLYSAESLLQKGNTRLVGLSNRGMSRWPDFREEWVSFPAHNGEDFEKAAGEWVSAIHAALGIMDGATHIEFIASAQGFELVELNPRLGGGLVAKSIRQTLGLNPYVHLLSQAVGINPPEQPTRNTGGFAYSLVYASDRGILSGVEGINLLKSFPGEVCWHPTKSAGDEIRSVRDQTGSVGIVSAAGATSIQALENALAAETVLRAVVSN